MRMLMNNLDPDVAEAPEELVVYGGIGRAARDWESYDKIVETLRRLEGDETLLVQSGKPVGVFRTHADAPRVLIANSNLVPHWATWDHFNELDRKGLMMYGQMTAGSWIYIGTQGIVQGTYETFAEMGRQHYDGDLRGRWILTAGLGGMGGAQPLAAVMAGAHCIAIECQESRIEKRLETRYLDRRATRIDEALDMLRAIAGADLGRPARQCGGDPARDGQARHQARRADRPDLGARPGQRLSADRLERRAMDRDARTRPQGGRAQAARASMAVHVEAMLAYREMGVPTFDYGNNIRQVAKDEGVTHAFDFPGLRAGLCAAALLPRHRPVPLVRAVGRSGGHLPDRRQGEGADPRRSAPPPLARHGARADRLPGPAGADLLGRAWASATGSASPSTRWWRRAN